MKVCKPTDCNRVWGWQNFKTRLQIPNGRRSPREWWNERISLERERGAETRNMPSTPTKSLGDIGQTKENCAAIDKLIPRHASCPRKVFIFDANVGGVRQPETPIKSTRLTSHWSYYTPVTAPRPFPFDRIRFNHRIGLANEKDWFVTGAKGADCRPLFAYFRHRDTNMAKTFRGSFIAIETTALFETRDLPNTERRAKKFRTAPHRVAKLWCA